MADTDRMISIPAPTLEALLDGAEWGYGEAAGQMTRDQADDLEEAITRAKALLSDSE
jgi:hypothetical protein